MHGQWISNAQWAIGVLVCLWMLYVSAWVSTVVLSILIDLITENYTTTFTLIFVLHCVIPELYCVQLWTVKIFRIDVYEYLILKHPWYDDDVLYRLFHAKTGVFCPCTYSVDIVCSFATLRDLAMHACDRYSDQWNYYTYVYQIAYVHGTLAYVCTGL